MYKLKLFISLVIAMLLFSGCGPSIMRWYIRPMIIPTDFEKLERAVRKKDKKKVDKLLKEGIDVDIEWSCTVLHVAAAYGNFEMVLYLIEKGADVNMKSLGGRTVLHFAAKSGNLEMVRYFVEEGLDVNAKADNGWTVLHSAIISSATVSGNLEVVGYLIEKGADVNAKTNYGMTVLNIAAGRVLAGHPRGYSGGNLEAVRYLIEKGADVNAKGWNGETALDIARKRGREDIVKILEEAQGR